MGLFSKFKKEREEAPPQNEESNQQHEDNEESSFNPIKNYKKKKEQKEKETLIINSLKPYKCTQKILMWNNGEHEVIYGYPVALIPTETGCVIFYRRRAVDFLEELIIKLKSTFLGYKEQYRILRVPEYCLLKSHDILTVYAHSFRVINLLTEEAVPIEGGDPRQRVFWEIERQKSEAYRNALHKILHDELPIILDRAISLNPTMRAYQGRESMKGRRESKAKEFSGVEIGFSVFDELENQLKKEAGIDE